MQILTDETGYDRGPCALALGMFDGVHLGHKALITRCVELAHRDGIVSAVDTFAEHPLRVLAPERAPERLMDNAGRAEKLERLGLDVLIMREFTASYAAQPPELFLERLCAALHPRYIIAGYNYTFGSKGAGDSALLMRLGSRFGFNAVIVEPVLYGGEPVSSTRIRALLAAGKKEEAQILLG